jgi:hypothetical protein
VRKTSGVISDIELMVGWWFDHDTIMKIETYQPFLLELSKPAPHQLSHNP